MLLNSAFERILYSLELLMLCICANSFFIIRQNLVYIIPCIVMFAAVLFLPMYSKNKPPPDGVYCISYGSRLNKAAGGRFPLNFTYGIAELYDKVNDGLVGESSFAYGEKYTLITVDGKHGVGHEDMIDLNRENLDGFDVREFYVNLASDLKSRGM